MEKIVFVLAQMQPLLMALFQRPLVHCGIWEMVLFIPVLPLQKNGTPQVFILLIW